MNDLVGELPIPKADFVLPKILPVRLGEYGRRLETIWREFEAVRNDGFYASDQNRSAPRFSKSYALHGLRAKYQRPIDPNSVFPDYATIQGISTVGVISSDIELEEYQRELGLEEETSGCADFFVPFQDFDSLSLFLQALRSKVGVGKSLIPCAENTVGSKSIMFAYDTSRPGLAPLMQYAMKDNDTNEKLWPNRINQIQYIKFPFNKSGMHLAVPVGLPANYIEYIILNEGASNWSSNRLKQLRDVAVCDEHPIPIVSVNTFTVI